MSSFQKWRLCGAIWLWLGFALGPASPQVPPDTSQSVDSLRIIPCGQAIGTFLPAARVTVADTVAGWAKVYVEGWVPVEAALPFLSRPRLDSTSVNALLGGRNLAEPAKAEVRQQCEATTSKGKRCSRKAEKKSKYCWQHQQR